MLQMMREVVNMFRKEKVYLFLLVAIFLFYFLFFLFHQKVRQEAATNLQKQRIETILRTAPQNAQEVERKLTSHPRLKFIVQLFMLLFVSSVAYGIWLGTVDLKKLFRKEALIPGTGQSLNISWGISEITKVLILFVSVGIALNLTILLFRLLFSLSIDTSNFMLIHTLVLDLTAVGIMIALIQKSGARVSDLTGISRIRPSEEFWWGIRTYFLVLPIFVCILVALVFISNVLSYEPPPHPLVEVLLEEKNLSFGTIFFSLLLACVIGPIVEETFFRGFFYPALKKYLGVGWTTVITTVLFAGVHENIFSFLPIFFLGLVLCYLYERRSNLVSCVTLHVIHNTAFIVYFFIMKNVLFSSSG